MVSAVVLKGDLEVEASKVNIKGKTTIKGNLDVG